MKRIKIILLLFVVNLSFSQSNEFLNDFERERLEGENSLSEFNQYNFSEIWLQTKETLVYGIIGKNHQRIRVKFLSVKRNPNNKNEYFVYGKSKVENNICDFRGTITLKKVFKSKELSYGVDDFYEGKLKSQGILIADYYFEEDENQKGSGIFKGKVYSRWCIFSKTGGKISYDDIEDAGDGYENNSFIGVWTSFRTQKSKICNWGDYRVPMANKDFDIGAGEFSPNDNYLKFGWENYRKSLLYGNKKAKEIEYREWWK